MAAVVSYQIVKRHMPYITKSLSPHHLLQNVQHVLNDADVELLQGKLRASDIHTSGMVIMSILDALKRREDGISSVFINYLQEFDQTDILRKLGVPTSPPKHSSPPYQTSLHPKDIEPITKSYPSNKFLSTDPRQDSYERNYGAYGRGQGDYGRGSGRGRDTYEATMPESWNEGNAGKHRVHKKKDAENEITVQDIMDNITGKCTNPQRRGGVDSYQGVPVPPESAKFHNRTPRGFSGEPTRTPRGGSIQSMVNECRGDGSFEEDNEGSPWNRQDQYHETGGKLQHGMRDSTADNRHASPHGQGRETLQRSHGPSDRLQMQGQENRSLLNREGGSCVYNLPAKLRSGQSDPENSVAVAQRTHLENPSSSDRSRRTVGSSRGAGHQPFQPDVLSQQRDDQSMYNFQSISKHQPQPRGLNDLSERLSDRSSVTDNGYASSKTLPEVDGETGGERRRICGDGNTAARRNITNEEFKENNKPNEKCLSQLATGEENGTVMVSGPSTLDHSINLERDGDSLSESASNENAGLEERAWSGFGTTVDTQSIPASSSSRRRQDENRSPFAGSASSQPERGGSLSTSLIYASATTTGSRFVSPTSSASSSPPRSPQTTSSTSQSSSSQSPRSDFSAPTPLPPSSASDQYQRQSSFTINIAKLVVQDGSQFIVGGEVGLTPKFTADDAADQRFPGRQGSEERQPVGTRSSSSSQGERQRRTGRNIMQSQSLPFVSAAGVEGQGVHDSRTTERRRHLEHNSCSASPQRVTQPWSAGSEYSATQVKMKAQEPSRESVRPSALQQQQQQQQQQALNHEEAREMDRYQQRRLEPSTTSSRNPMPNPNRNRYFDPKPKLDLNPAFNTNPNDHEVSGSMSYSQMEALKLTPQEEARLAEMLELSGLSDLSGFRMSESHHATELKTRPADKRECAAPPDEETRLKMPGDEQVQMGLPVRKQQHLDNGSQVTEGTPRQIYTHTAAEGATTKRDNDNNNNDNNNKSTKPVDEFPKTQAAKASADCRHLPTKAADACNATVLHRPVAAAEPDDDEFSDDSCDITVLLDSIEPRRFDLHRLRSVQWECESSLEFAAESDALGECELPSSNCASPADNNIPKFTMLLSQ